MTIKNVKDEKYLKNLRHTCSHLLAAAVKSLWPDTKPTLGPPIDEGFYYDFDFGKTKISKNDLPKIEKEMTRIVKTWKNIEGGTISAKGAKELFKGNVYKRELIDEFSKDKQKITTYQSGTFVDLCRGGHIENPAKEIKHFKLLSVAGAYWRGNEKNKMLTRIYGTCFPTEGDLGKHLKLLEEAKKRDHRKIGKNLELFTFSNKVGPGLVLWMPKGTIIKDELEKFGKATENKWGYQRVSTPHLGKEELFLTSGHLPYYQNEMYPAMEYENEKYYLKPMNCPHMHLIYSAKPRSYKEFPIRFAEFGTVYRHEDRGTLIGTMRVRGHTTNDAHIYCLEEQVIDELVDVIKLHQFYYKLFGIKDYYVELALPDFDKKKDKYLNEAIAWEKSIKLLQSAAKTAGIKTVEKEGAAAFYGPKFDFVIKSAIGRKFGASTNQLDFGSGKRFGLTYTAKNGQEEIVPYIIHRAPLGSHERFIGFLIEHWGGNFPVWLAPVQVKILPITERNIKYSQTIVQKLADANIRVEFDDRNQTLQAKIRKSQLEKVPYMLVIGDKEEKANKARVRDRAGKDRGLVDIKDFIHKIQKEINNKVIN